MQTKNQSTSSLGSEIRIIPIWAWVLAGLAFIAAQIFFNGFASDQDDKPVPGLLFVMGLAAGCILGTYLLFVGYVNRDARRRGMNPLLWTLVTIFIPNGLGILVYFVLRQPRSGMKVPADSAGLAVPTVCPRCFCAVNWCPSCGMRLASATTQPGA